MAEVYVRAKFPYTAQNERQLSLTKGQVFVALGEPHSSGWWKSRIEGKVGIVPTSYVERLSDEELEALAQASTPVAPPPPPADVPEPLQLPTVPTVINSNDLPPNLPPMPSTTPAAAPVQQAPVQQQQVAPPAVAQPRTQLRGFMLHNEGEKEWSTRYCILNNGILEGYKDYYSSPDNPKPRFQWRVYGCKVEIVNGSNGRPFVFDFTEAGSNKTQQLHCMTDKELKLWVDAIVNASRQNLGNSPAVRSNAPAAAVVAAPKKDDKKKDDKKDKKGKKEEKHDIFGVPIKQVVEIQPSETYSDVPLIVDKCIDYLRRVNAHELEGVFRISGSSSEITRIKALFNTGIVPDLDTVNDPHIVTGILKLWLRELPDPLIPFDNYDGFIAAWKKGKTEADRTTGLSSELKKLPFENFSTLKLLMNYLHYCCQFTSVNRMAPNNMAIVFSPTLMQAKISSLDLLLDMNVTAEITQHMVEEYDVLFG